MKKLLLLASIAVLTACSSMKEVQERKTYAQPSWYKDCAQAGKEGWFWWEKEYAYACGSGESTYVQASDEQMYAIAMNNFAKRINGEVNSETEIKFVDDRKSTYTRISYAVKSTVISEHVQVDRDEFTMDGKHYTFTRLKMSKPVFDQLVADAKAQRVSKQ